MIHVNRVFTEILSDTEFDVDYIYVGSFFNGLSHLKTEDTTVIFEQLPFILIDKSDYILLNKNNENLIQSIKSLKFNYKTLSIKIIKTNLHKTFLEDIFELINIKNRSRNSLENDIKGIIINRNQAINYLCKPIQKQLGHINKTFLTNKLSSQTLSRINKDIDLYLCEKIIIERDLFEIDDFNIKEKLQENKNKIKKVFLSEIISNSSDLDIKSIHDIDIICNHIKNNKLTKSFHLSKMKSLFYKLSEKSKSPPSVKSLFQVIESIESTRKERNENYIFFIHSWNDVNEEKVIEHLLKEMDAINE